MDQSDDTTGDDQQEQQQRDSDDEAGMDEEQETIEDQDVFRAWKTCREMVTDRGYDIDDTHLVEAVAVRDVANLTFVEDKPYLADGQTSCQLENTNNNYIIVKPSAAAELSIYATKPASAARLKVVFCSYNASTQKNCLKKYKEEEEIDNIIFIIKNNPTSILSNFTIFRYNEVIFNRTHHRLVPPHKILSVAEKTEVLRAYDCKESQIPRMAKTDFIARYFGASVGDMFEIHRPSPSCGTYVTYRLVK